MDNKTKAAVECILQMYDVAVEEAYQPWMDVWKKMGGKAKRAAQDMERLLKREGFDKLLPLCDNQHGTETTNRALRAFGLAEWRKFDLDTPNVARRIASAT